jgi:hypothetical protein
MMSGPPLPDPAAAGEVLATVNDWRAIMVVQMFLIITLIMFIIWREFSLVGLRKAIDRVSDSLWLLRLSLIEDRAKEHDE